MTVCLHGLSQPWDSPWAAGAGFHVKVNDCNSLGPWHGPCYAKVQPLLAAESIDQG